MAGGASGTDGETAAQASDPTRVVILGGGPAGAAAAYWLSRPDQEGRYHVTLYSQGWRLGGKCASGRNAEMADRIEEHGLHMLMGCYQNGFATMRALYDDWRSVKKDPQNPFQSWTDAFKQQLQVTLMERDGPGDPPSWLPWNMKFPSTNVQPGDGLDNEPSPEDSLSDALGTMCDWLSAQMTTDVPAAGPILAAIEALRVAQADLASDEVEFAVQELTTANSLICDVLSAAPSGFPLPVTFRRILILANLGLSVGRGLLVDILGRGQGAFDALNSLDFRDWLQKHGACPVTLASAPVSAIYDLAFAAVNGNAQGLGTLAAGVSLRAQLEMVLGYRGAPLWKMAAGMGDTVFTPFWDVLTARGVDVRLFSRVIALRPGEDGTLSEIDIVTQAVTKDGEPYRPLVRVKDLDCWPNQPLWDQLADGETLKADKTDFESSTCEVAVPPATTLVAGQDFDLAIVALPPAVLKDVTGDLGTASPAWQGALEASVSVPTQSLQLWMKPTLPELGWELGSTVMTAYAKPYDSWGDMTHVLERESWPPGSEPGSLGYFCGTLERLLGATPGMIRGVAYNEADNWSAGNIGSIWPQADKLTLASPDVASSYVRANFDGSELYVQTPAGGNVASRFDPARPAGFTNLYAIGDWTLTRFSGGCFESAIESAMLASRAISGLPLEIKTA